MLRALVLLLILSATRPVSGWDQGGHEIIATIVYARLNPQARAAVDQFAREVPTDRAPYDAVTMACWMDDLRAQDPAMADHGMFLAWHFIDIGLQPGDPVPSFQPGDDNPWRGNAVQALKRAMVVLQGGTDPYVTGKAIACAMIMHLVGDIHQPLHAATKYFYSHGGLQNDRGGNREEVDNGPEDQAHFILHAFWDAAWRATMDAQGRVTLDERFNLGLVREDEIAPLAAQMAIQNAPLGVRLDTNFDAWAWESNQVARHFVYPSLTPTESLKACRLSSGYIVQANRIAQQRLVLAAYRLAVLLNSTLGSQAPGSPPASYPAGPPGNGY